MIGCCCAPPPNLVLPVRLTLVLPQADDKHCNENDDREGDAECPVKNEDENIHTCLVQNMYPKIPNGNGKSKDTGHRIPSPRVEY